MSVWQMKKVHSFFSFPNFDRNGGIGGKMIFGDRINKKNQEINRYHSARVEDWLPYSEADTNTAVFGGTDTQRNIVVEQGIIRCFGRVGIVIIHNNSRLENDLQNFQVLFPEEVSASSNTPVCFVNSRNLCYEPFYGMSYNRAVEAIYPELSKESPMYMQQHLCSVALKAYMDILHYKNIPVDLDNLLYLCNLDLRELERRECANLPENVSGDILAVLTQENITRQVKADVNYFATQMEGRLWEKRQKPSDVSMIEAVKHKAMISIRIPSNNIAVLDYLASELDCLLECGAPCLLVTDSVILGQSRLKNTLMNQSDALRTILAGSSIQELFDGAQEEGENAMHRAAKIILFQCANAVAAKQYSDLIGEYLRQFVSVSNHKNKGAFDIFSGRGKGKNIEEQLYARIKPEELVKLGEGAVLINQRNGEVDLIKKLY